MCWHLVKKARACGYKGAKLAVLVAVAERANPKKGNRCWPSVATLSKDAGYCIRTVQAKLRELEAEGRLTRFYRSGRSTRYWVHPDGACIPARNAGVQELHDTPATLATNPGSNCAETNKNHNRIRKAVPVDILASRIAAQQVEREAAVDGAEQIDPETFGDFVKSYRERK